MKVFTRDFEEIYFVELQLDLNFGLLEFKKSLIFQIFNLSEDDDLEVDKNLHVLRFEYSILQSFNILELQFFLQQKTNVSIYR